MNEQREQIVGTWIKNLDPNRFTERENAIQKWLNDNNAKTYLDRAQELISSLNKEEIINEFKIGIESGLEFCSELEKIQALDFSWYYGGDSVDVAYAYALGSCHGQGKLFGTDLGPEEIPGLESDLKHGSLLDEDFSELPVHWAINLYVEELNPSLEEALKNKRIPSDAENLLLDLFQIWNYRLGTEACKNIPVRYQNALKKRKPFWISMTRHGRWSVPIGLI
ncbi:hypothetical protein EHQ12_07915 [Leptospira gomenensis]|uniref:Uncharacterized protein n=1 Tax=Leptospira gomenensis TaxID=2484974 RepID=A0A5F1YYY9_9LEPT|nr:hypothetical protein [Leptospira gomenensis]TGK36008.1 hypothetical protein EHQ17_05380 [Leptospira gomenensis]TGK39960.1 hypothetical protein EHQ12_07915 [Leptospira gomenensis]TGK51410.1 hypothetical protein EHQ07_02305 [Leptospira gomenensis]TGK64915.1 hypothetical protein EHQ13_06650 [Leptospira gomenensis]